MGVRVSQCTCEGIPVWVCGCPSVGVRVSQCGCEGVPVWV